ncbi:MAG: exo-alpha-sialidase [Pirellulales bacterium]|nr:exo-alpha-sialidase [Pirellulales bacterium]
MSAPKQPVLLTRRHALKAAAATALGLSAWNRAWAQSTETPDGLIGRIDRSVIFEGRSKNRDWSWFHPRACMAPGPKGPVAIMTLQSISGSDFYKTVHWTASTNLGKTWSQPQPIPGMDQRPTGDGLTVGVCDVVPEYHPPTKTVLAMGHNVYYEPTRLARRQGPRWPVYSVRDALGHWSALQKLEWDDPRRSLIYTCGCGQRATLPDGHVLVPLSFGPKGREDRMVATVRCTFDGRTLTVRELGNVLELRVKRGLLEPSITMLDGRYYMTLRAEDNRGYVTTSDDGLNWARIEPWRWDDGTPLDMSTTQQHWLTHSDGLFLVYTRKMPENIGVFRWRSPLLLAEVDRKTMRLKRQTEQIVFPLIGDGIKDGKNVARLGNFHVTNATPHESWVTVSEGRPTAKYRGDTLLAKIHWTRPNRLVGE